MFHVKPWGCPHGTEERRNGMVRIPEGWSLLTAEPDYDKAWRLAVEFKQTREAVRNSLFVRTRVMPSFKGYWVLIKEEERE